MNDPSDWKPARQADGRFLPGSGGRPPGARNRLSRRIVEGLLRHYEEHEAEILRLLMHKHTPDFVRMVGALAGIGPEDAQDLEPLTAEELAARAALAETRRKLADEASRRRFLEAIAAARRDESDAK